MHKKTVAAIVVTGKAGKEAEIAESVVVVQVMRLIERQQ